MKREDVEERLTWKIEDIYSSDEAWDDEFESFEKSIDFSEYRGKLGDRDTLLKFLKYQDWMTERGEKLAVYANMRQDTDGSSSRYVGMWSRVGAVFSRYAAESAFAEPEMAALDEDYLNALIADSDFKDYDRMLRDVLRRRPHTLSEKEERIMALASDSLSGFRDIFSMIDNVDLPLPEIEINGKTQKLTHGSYGVALRSSDRDTRSRAYKAYYAAYISLIDAITSTYSSSVKADVFETRARGFGSSLERALFYEEVDRSVYDNLLKSVSAALPSLHRYMRDRKKILGLDEMRFYDVYAPLSPESDAVYTYDEAYDEVMRGLAPLGPDYVALLKKGKDERWLDVCETEGKRSGAYSISSKGIHPYVLLNFTGTLSDVFTIAHEMGHSLHSYFSFATQPQAKADYKIFVAEVASTVNEVLLLKSMLKEAEEKKDERTKAYLLNYYLDMFRATYFRQTMFAEFEQEAHEMCEKDIPLTKDNLCELYGNLGWKYYGDAVVHDYEISCEWMRIPHFYTAFYVYKYSTGIAAAVSIADKILKEGQSAVDGYMKFLSSGCSDDPVALLRLAGVDLSTCEPFDLAAREFDDALGQLEKATGIEKDRK